MPRRWRRTAASARWRPAPGGRPPTSGTSWAKWCFPATTSPRLNDQEKLEEAARGAAESLDKLAPGLREKIHGEKLTKLPADQRRAWEKPKDKRSDAETALAAEADGQLFVGNDEVARRVTGANRREALRLAEQANHDTELANIIRRERSHVNFVFWRTRAEMEQTPDALAVRKAVYDARHAYYKADLQTARDNYEKAIGLWRKLLDRFAALKDDVVTGQDLMDVMRQYRECLKKLDKEFPKPFILQEIIDKYERYQ